MATNFNSLYAQPLWMVVLLLL